MNAITMEYPDSWLVSMGTDASRFARDAKMAAAVKLFEVGKFSSGQAARFAGIGRAEFLLSCKDWEVDSVAWDDAEIDSEFATPLPERG